MKTNTEVHLFEPATGLRGVEKSDNWGGDDFTLPPDELDHAVSWWWEEGNGGCICNRAMSLDRAAGKFSDRNDYHCNLDRRIIVEKIVVDGKIVYRENADGCGEYL